MAPIRTLLAALLAIPTTTAFVCTPADARADADAAMPGIPCPAEPVGGPLNPAVFASQAAKAAAPAASASPHRTFEFELMRTAIAAHSSSAAAAAADAVPTLKSRLITPLPLRPGAKTFRRPVPGMPVVDLAPTTLIQQVKPTKTAGGSHLPTFNAAAKAAEMEKREEIDEEDGTVEMGNAQTGYWKVDKREEIDEEDGTVEMGNAQTGYWKMDKREEIVEENGAVEMGNAQTGYWKINERQERPYGGADELGEFGNAKTGWWKIQPDEWFEHDA